MGKRSRRRARLEEGAASPRCLSAGEIEVLIGNALAVGGHDALARLAADWRWPQRDEVGRRLVGRAVVVESETYRDDPAADERWLAQVNQLGARFAWSASFLGAWAEEEGLPSHDALGAVCQLLSLFGRLPTLVGAGSRPGAWGAPGHRRAGELDPKLLERVRNLLAKAESTPFGEESEAFSAKAQELMSRYSIDQAMLGSAGEGPSSRRIGIEDPYAKAKCILLSIVAGASRCRAVWTQALGFSTVFGYPADLEAVELLFTSLLVQASHAMLADGALGALYRSRGFRQSFLVAYAERVGERLRRAAEAALSDAEAQHGGRLLPVLVGREKAVEAARDEVFPKTGSFGVRVSDGRGWQAGREAADRADLGRAGAVAGGRQGLSLPA